MITVTVDAGPILKLATRFRDARPRFDRALREGLNEGGDKVFVAVRRALHQRMGTIRYRSITSRTRRVRAVQGGLVYRIIGTGKGLPINEFRVRGRGGPGGGVTGAPWGISRKFQRSFVGRGKMAGKFLARRSDERFPIRMLRGPSVAKEMRSKPVALAFYRGVRREVGTAVLKRLARALVI